MIIGIMVSPDAGPEIGLARLVFDERNGLSRRELHKLYQQARYDLTAKLKKLEELAQTTEVKDDR